MARRPLTDAEVALVKKLLEDSVQQEPSNDDDQIDEAAIRARMQRVVERVKRARNQR